MESIIYLIRHGEIDLWGKKRLIGQVDLRLSEQGREQAHLYKQAFVPPWFDHIYCSDLMRSLETARIIASPEEETIRIEPRLREINFGFWDGREVAEVQQAYPEEWGKREQDVIHYTPPAGESFVDLARRVLPAFEEIVAQTDKRVLVVGHAGVNRVILTKILGMPLEQLFRIQQEYGSYILMAHKNGEWRLFGVNIRP